MQDSSLPTNRSRIAAQQITDPGAGNEFDFNIPAIRYARILGVRARLGTDGTVATRWPALNFHIATFPMMRFIARDTIPASSTFDFFWAAGYSGDVGASSNAVASSMGNDIYLDGNWNIGSITENLQAGDVWSSIFIIWERFIATTP